MSKFKVHQFDPTIYPRKFWVCEGGTREDISRVFQDMDYTDKDIEAEEVESSNALTFPAIMRETREYGVVVWLHHKSKCDWSAVTHEAVHAANFIFLACGVGLDLENDEPQAYLAGFCGDCITQVKLRKFKS